MSKLIVEIDTNHKLYNTYVEGRINGLGMATLHLLGEDPKHFAITGKRRSGETDDYVKIMTFEGSDEALEDIAQLITKECNTGKFEGLCKFSGTYPWND